jgi:hypothetical protein
MTTHAPAETANPSVTAALPTQAARTESVPATPVIDHVHAHAVKCYWDFTECHWVCSDG